MTEEPETTEAPDVAHIHSRITQIKEAAESVLAHLKRHLPEHHDDESDSTQP
jgi:hypothetical protein